MTRIRLAFLLVTLSSISAASSTDAPISRSIDFSVDPKPTTLTSSTVEVTLQPVFGGEGDVEVITSVRAAGYQSIIVREGFSSSPGYKRIVLIGKLTGDDSTPSVLLGGFSGGAHCCATLRVVTPSAGKLKILDFPSIDGEPSTAFPTDLDGDGTRDFVRQDDIFRYQFASGAGSYSPPIIYNIYKGQLVDVSDQPAFRPVWIKYANQVRIACSDRKNEDRNGACIALVAAGARLGIYPSLLKEAVANANPKGDLPESCSVDLVQYACPKGKEIKFYTFETAANWFLRRGGYID